MLEGLLGTINSDDPAYFGGYLNDNYLAIAEALDLSRTDIVTLAKNSFAASFLDNKTKKRMIQNVEEYYQANP